MIDVVLAVIQNKLRDLDFHCPGPPPPTAADIRRRMIDAIEKIIPYVHEVPTEERKERIESWVNDLEDRVDEWEYLESSSTKSTLELSIAADVERKHKEIIGWNLVPRAYDVRLSCSPYMASVIGIGGQESEVERLVTWLSEENTPFRIIYVSGEVGSGKSRVVSKACDRVKRQFHIFKWLWICGSSIGKVKDTWDYCHSYIEKNAKKKYLLVLDGIEDATNIQDYWNSRPPPSNGGGGRVVIITRGSIPTQHLKDNIKIEPLSPDGALKLFHVKASHLCTSSSSSILSKCGGSPLLISLIGGLVSTTQAWAEAVDKLKNDHLLRNADQLAAGDKVQKFLSISYTSLPPLVKACFLYTCVMFPKDMEISKTQLIRIWLAEGFVQRRLPGSNNITAEEAAEIYFNQLIQRSMVEIVKLKDNGDVKTCRILQPMQSFATKILSSSPKLSFILSIDGNDDQQCGSLSSRHPQLRRVSINTYGRSISKYIINNSSEYPKLRSLLFWGEIEEGRRISTDAHSNNICNFFSSSKLIRVLILQAIPVEKVASLDRLLLLRYLGLKSTPIKDLPAPSLGRLQKLETLDVRDTEELKRLPQCTRSLVKLRHLLLTKSSSEKALEVPLQFLSGSTDLQTLTGLDLMGVVESFVQKHLEKLITKPRKSSVQKYLEKLSTKLRKFSVKVTGEHSGYLCTSLNKMEFLRSLTIHCARGHLNIASLINNQLAKLRIGGEIGPNSLQTISKFNSVVSLSLWDSKMTEDPLPTLSRLPKLVRLTLHTAYNGTDICPLPEGFSSLKHMSIFWLHNLERWGEIGTAAMTNLKTLNLTKCVKLRQPPEGLQNRVFDMSVKGMNSDFEAAVRQGSYTVRII